MRTLGVVYEGTPLASNHGLLEAQGLGQRRTRIAVESAGTLVCWTETGNWKAEWFSFKEISLSTPIALTFPSALPSFRNVQSEDTIKRQTLHGSARGWWSFTSMETRVGGYFEPGGAIIANGFTIERTMLRRVTKGAIDSARLRRTLVCGLRRVCLLVGYGPNKSGRTLRKDPSASRAARD